ncbi:MAG: hydrogenase maturation protease [Brevefilum sp.]|nr:hydrogenase maturation protease [Brevefilum sp.]MDT8381090.1 hydrogenase maturation protease [Brevefilum sp.]MDW7754194.1 hydrogenase maturation protease [Brevefilum sp.]
MVADTLIIGYGNADRQDDGAGWHIVRNLAERLGLSVSDDPGASIEIEHDLVDLIFDLQIYPELAETISQYKRVCFVDAHTSDIPEEISWVVLSPEYEKSPLTHHMSPRTVLSIAKTVYDKVPEAILVSVRGFKFQFERELSPKTARLTQQAADRIWDWIHQG